MNGFNLLEITLRDILDVINPLREDWNVRFHIIRELRAVVESIESLRGATVEPFGSFASNLFTRWGDLDISIELPNGSYISSPGKKHKQSLLGDVLKALRSKGGWHKLQFISNARVPILKFEGRENISCDISINNLGGQMKSKLLFWINEIDGRFRDLVLLVKEWAKAHNINDPKSGTLNSYTLTLLVVFHLQTLEPAILPPLREIYPGNMIDDLTGVRAVAEKRIEETCAVHINRIKSDKLRIINRSSLSELFISFLAKFFETCSRASVQGVSPYAGQWEDINSNMRWLPRTYALFVEDPFEQPVNTARTVGSNQLMKISEAARATHQLLVSSNHSRTSLIMNLVRPQISHFVTRTPVRHQATAQSMPRTPSNNYIRKGVGTHQNASRKQIPGQLQQQFQNRRVDNGRNGTIMNGQLQNTRVDNSRNGTMSEQDKASPSQRHVWRPARER
ncbi:protein HESO1-like isoform X1 [Olea europaea var. sylvestris]|uniref:HESO1 n=1 Tax=Olea europaea subsp. europaea TaxID=158383 RepID=A0A8S0PA85_OLEEU|nr:protein HESO1-like isoform X1 [Olea europaea var. sylvestris]CAA2934545.1 HESO1 [Olea europaea subsp. europaea]